MRAFSASRDAYVRACSCSCAAIPALVAATVSAMCARSATESWRVATAGLPSHSSPRLTTAPAGTTAPPATTACDWMQAPSPTMAPGPTRQSFSRVHAVRIAPESTTTPEPTVIAAPDALRRMALLPIVVESPIEIAPESPRTTAPYHTEAFAPRFTAPTMDADGATKAPAPTEGALSASATRRRCRDTSSLGSVLP
eukprot:Amastigsp_a345333_28.p2 type:complete len:197 gc:universal Amastigsp_a345333_28:115-705(+)